MAPDVTLREVRPEDLPVFFRHAHDPEARHMSAFDSPEPPEPEAHAARWARKLADPDVTTRTIEHAGEVVGNIGTWLHDGRREVFYGIGREHWGRGLASAALAAFVAEVAARPLHASVAADNARSRRVLEKCGFVPCGEGMGFAAARGCETAEAFYVLGG
jgi:RimJ/RimL family protein N-acetyltransferase